MRISIALMEITQTLFLPFRNKSQCDISVVNFLFLNDMASANFFLDKQKQKIKIYSIT